MVPLELKIFSVFLPNLRNQAGDSQVKILILVKIIIRISELKTCVTISGLKFRAQNVWGHRKLFFWFPHEARVGIKKSRPCVSEIGF